MGNDTAQNLSKWGGGIRLKTIKDNFTSQFMSETDVYNNADYDGKLILRNGLASQDKEGNYPVYVY